MSYTGKAIDLNKYEKYGKNVELSKMEVELGVTDDIKFQLKSINEFLNKANAADNKLQKAVSSVNELYAPYKLNLGYAEEVKLGKHEVELSAINDLETLVNKSRSVEGEMVENYLDAKKFAQISITAAKNHLKNLESVYVLVNNIRTQGDALGVDVTKIQEWKRGADFLNGNPKASTQIMIKKLEGLK
jgi:hypothetical protein